MNPPSGGETITGAERIGWDQPASDAVDLSTFRYAMYVDGTRTELAGVTCAPSTGPARFACTARLPALTPGAHALQIASFVVDGSTLESARSAALNVTVAPLTASATPPPQAAAGLVRARDAESMRVETLLDRVDDPVDLAFAPDGRLFVAERSAVVRVLAPGAAGNEPVTSRVAAAPRGTLLALTIDPQFARTHFVYVLLAAPADDGGWRSSIARLREVAGTLADATVILDGIRLSAAPAGALRFGPDALLYAAFDGGDDPRLAGDPASFNGKVLRLNADGTTPRDQPGGTPVVASDLASPVGVAWLGHAMWIADRRSDGASRLRTIAGVRPGSDRSHAPTGAIVGRAATAYTLPTGIVATALAATGDGALLVSSSGGAGLLRVRIDYGTQAPIAIERLLADGADVRAAALAADGTIAFATAGAIRRLVARPR